MAIDESTQQMCRPWIDISILPRKIYVFQNDNDWFQSQGPKNDLLTLLPSRHSHVEYTWDMSDRATWNKSRKQIENTNLFHLFRSCVFHVLMPPIIHANEPCVFYVLMPPIIPVNEPCVFHLLMPPIIHENEPCVFHGLMSPIMHVNKHVM